MVLSTTLALVTVSIVVMAFGNQVCKDPNAMKNNRMVSLRCGFPVDKFAAGVGKGWCDTQIQNGVQAKWDEGNVRCDASEGLLAGNMEGNEADKPQDGTHVGNFLKACDVRKDKDGNNVTNFDFVRGYAAYGYQRQGFFTSESCLSMTEHFKQPSWGGPQMLNGSCESCTILSPYTGNTCNGACLATYLALLGCCSDFAPDCNETSMQGDAGAVQMQMQMCMQQAGLAETSCAMLENYSGGISGTCPASTPCVPFVVQVEAEDGCAECTTWPCTWKPCSNGSRKVCSSS